MKRILSFYYTKFFIFCQALALLACVFFSVTPQTVSASTNDFYFEDAVFDYYLQKAEDGTSRLHVEETLTAVFPDTNQNHGITRSIPYTNQNGTNLTASNINALNFKVTRNGQPEKVAKTEVENNSYIFYVGDKNTFVHNRQVYVLSYDFTNVIANVDSSGYFTFNDAEAILQELYWDTNGNGWSQEFSKLTARLHLESNELANYLPDETSCYVGRYGEKGSERCTISWSGNIISFTTTRLLSRENLTFSVSFKPNTFSVPEPPKNYSLVITTVVIALLCILIISLRIHSYLKNVKPKKDYYKGLFTAPQYEAPKNYCAAEAAELYLGSKEKTYVASLLELAISKKISIVRGEPSKILKKDTWSIIINNLDNVTDSQDDLLRILNGGSKVHVHDNIKIKKHTATATLASLSRSYHSDAIDNLKKLKLFETKKSITSSSKSSGSALASVGVIIGVFAFIFVVFSILAESGLELFMQLFSSVGYSETVGSSYLPGVIFTIFAITIIFCIHNSNQKQKYSKYTNAGLDAANYLDGLRLYIDMAEKDRLKFLQSVKGADTSPKGIVHLYEKLLPYACLFGCEESWFKELGKYCEQINYNPDWYSGNDLASFYVINSIANSVNSSVSASTSYTSSSSGSSSGFSGGGGGGFSGGGGGGGGGGGW